LDRLRGLHGLCGRLWALGLTFLSGLLQVVNGGAERALQLRALFGDVR
jgi:hypothetical protein